MTNNLPSLLVAVADRAAIVKVKGRANFTTSVGFKRLVSELSRRGLDDFVLDLTECVTMDSTFLGVLAGTALRMAESGRVLPPNDAQTETGGTARLRLLNPNPRVADLLENLGISELFCTIQEPPRAEGRYEAQPPQAPPTKEELTRTCLEAHKLLMDLNPENVPKFKEVAQFLAEDLKACVAIPEVPSDAAASNQPAPAGAERT
jgi:anti-sigma B factor antagonist